MRITKLDGLRGIFSLMVVVYHYPVQFIPAFIHDFFIVAKSHLFVEFFFVLSGFVISYNYNHIINTTRELGLFLKKRVIRLYPLLLFSTLLCFFMQVGVKVLMPHVAKSKDSFLPTIVDTIDTLLFLNSTPIITNRLGMNFPSWSISAEMIAYLFFGIVTLWAIGRQKNLILAATIILGMIFLVVAAYLGMKGNYNFVRGLVSFNIGYFVYIFSNKKNEYPSSWEIVILVSFIGFFYLTSIIEEPTLVAFVQDCIIPMFFGAAIFTLIHTNGIISKAMDMRPFQFLGKISYSVYLNHAIFILVVPPAIFAVLKLPETLWMELFVFAVIVASLIIYSNVTYNIIEVRGGSLFKRLLMRKSGEPATRIRTTQT